MSDDGMITVQMPIWEEQEELLAADAYDFKLSEDQLRRFEAEIDALMNPPDEFEWNRSIMEKLGIGDVRKTDGLGSSVLFFDRDLNTGVIFRSE